MSDTFAPDPREDSIEGRYRGEGGELFWLALWTGVLTLLTLGIFRFWAKTRIRRYMWSATSPGGAPFEYSGTGLEKFLGFLVAIVVLAVYLGILQLILFAVGLSVFSGGTSDAAIAAQIAATYITFFALLPLIYYASYRMRRYILARTRWRGVRFGADKAAWGFTWRALGYTFLNVITFGLLAPLMTFKLEKFVTDRTWYGDTKFVQGGTWGMLYKAMTHVFIALGIMVVGGIAMGLGSGDFGVAFMLGVVALVIGYIWLFIGFVHYNVVSFNIMANNKTLGENIRFRAQVRTSTVVGKWIVGYLLISLILTAALIPIGGIMAIAAFGIGSGLDNPEDLLNLGAEAGFLFIIGLAYIFILVLASALTLVFIRQPIVKHYVEEVTVLNASELDKIRQRSGHDQVDAEGFADALDVGAAF